MTDHDHHVLAIAGAELQWQRIRSHALPGTPARLVLPVAERKRDATGRRVVGYLNPEHAFLCTADLLHRGWRKRDIDQLNPPDRIVHN